MKELSIQAFREALDAGAWMLDARPAGVFTEGFIPGAVQIGLDGDFTRWLKLLAPEGQPVVVIALPGDEAAVAEGIAAAGIRERNIAGYLAGGWEAWREAGLPSDMIIGIEPDELAMDMPHDQKLEIIDVREAEDYEASHIRGATHIALSGMGDLVNIAVIDGENNLYIHSGTGYRSVVAASLLKKHGYHNLRVVTGGFEDIGRNRKIPLVTNEKKA